MTVIQTRKRLSSGEPTLDEMMGGGFIEGSATLVSGAPGVGKTTLGIQFLVAGAAKGEAGILVTFEEFPASMLRDARNLGWNLQRLQEEQLLRVIFTSPQVFLSSLQAPDSPLAEAIRTLAPTRAVIDSASHFKRMNHNPVQLREIYNSVVNGLKREGITSLILDEDANISKPRDGRMPPLPFVVDSVFLMRYVEIDSEIRRALTILKMRGSRHNKDIRSYSIGQGGLKLGEPFKDIQGLLSGFTHRVR